MFKKTCLDPFADKVKCYECRHWIDKSDAQKVEASGFYDGDRWYCQLHKKPYSRVRTYAFADLATRFFGEVEMNKDGTPIGYKKIK